MSHEDQPEKEHSRQKKKKDKYKTWSEEHMGVLQSNKEASVVWLRKENEMGGIQLQGNEMNNKDSLSHIFIRRKCGHRQRVL